MRRKSESNYSRLIVRAWFKENRIEPPMFEYKFLEDRKFLFDMAWPKERIALEVEGGIFVRGAHGSISGILRDIEKYNLAAQNGWRVLRILPRDVCTHHAVELVAAAFQWTTQLKTAHGTAATSS